MASLISFGGRETMREGIIFILLNRGRQALDPVCARVDIWLVTLIECLLWVVVWHFKVGTRASRWVTLEIRGSSSWIVKSWIDVLIKSWVASLFLNLEALKSDNRTEWGHGNSLTDFFYQVMLSQLHCVMMRWEVSSSQSSLYQVLVRNWWGISGPGGFKDTAVSSESGIAFRGAWDFGFRGVCCILEGHIVVDTLCHVRLWVSWFVDLDFFRPSLLETFRLVRFFQICCDLLFLH